jgi:hypothetical protein
VLDPYTLSLTMDCDPFKNTSINIPEFVRNENGVLACYDVWGRHATVGDLLEIVWSEIRNGRARRRQRYTQKWRDGAPWSRM